MKYFVHKTCLTLSSLNFAMNKVKYESIIFFETTEKRIKIKMKNDFGIMKEEIWVDS